MATKLTADEVRNIRRLIASGEMTAAQIARDYGLAAETVRRIFRRETWAHLEQRAGEKKPEAYNAEVAASIEQLMKELKT